MLAPYRLHVKGRNVLNKPTVGKSGRHAPTDPKPYRPNFFRPPTTPSSWTIRTQKYSKTVLLEGDNPSFYSERSPKVAILSSCFFMREDDGFELRQRELSHCYVCLRTDKPPLTHRRCHYVTSGLIAIWSRLHPSSNTGHYPANEGNFALFGRRTSRLSRHDRRTRRMSQRSRMWSKGG
jgi:hypothetical protein